MNYNLDLNIKNEYKNMSTLLNKLSEDNKHE